MIDPTPITPSEPDAKQTLRTSIRATVAALEEDERHAASVAACQRLVQLESFAHASTVLLYMPIRHELDVTSAAIHCFRMQKTVCVPRVDWSQRDMVAVETTSFDDTVMDVDAHGIRTPRAGRLVPPNLIDLVIVPGLAFDAAGGRLGRGGGFYDRYLTRLRRGAIAVGVGFDQQFVDRVPVVDEDTPVDFVVTDRRVTRCGHSRSRR